MQSSIKLNSAKFDGPLDLLLEVVRSRQLDLATVNLIDLVEQYLDIVKTKNLSTHAEYASIAATLIAIKCRRLLPVEEEEIDEEKQLRDKLVLYQKYHHLSTKIKKDLDNKKIPIYKEENILSKYVENVSIENNGNEQDIVSALWLIIERSITKKSFDTKLVEKDKISPKIVNQETDFFLVGGEPVNYLDFIQNKTKEFVIYSFLHLLNLIKNSLVEIIKLSDNKIIIKGINNE